MRLKELDLVEAVHLLDGDRVSVDAGFFRLLEHVRGQLRQLRTLLESTVDVEA